MVQTTIAVCRPYTSLHLQIVAAGALEMECVQCTQCLHIVFFDGLLCFEQRNLILSVTDKMFQPNSLVDAY